MAGGVVDVRNEIGRIREMAASIEERILANWSWNTRTIDACAAGVVVQELEKFGIAAFELRQKIELDWVRNSSQSAGKLQLPEVILQSEEMIQGCREEPNVTAIPAVQQPEDSEATENGNNFFPNIDMVDLQTSPPHVFYDEKEHNKCSVVDETAHSAVDNLQEQQLEIQVDKTNDFKNVDEKDNGPPPAKKPRFKMDQKYAPKSKLESVVRKKTILAPPPPPLATSAVFSSKLLARQPIPGAKRPPTPGIFAQHKSEIGEIEPKPLVGSEVFGHILHRYFWEFVVFPIAETKTHEKINKELAAVSKCDDFKKLTLDFSQITVDCPYLVELKRTLYRAICTEKRVENDQLIFWLVDSLQQTTVPMTAVKPMPLSIARLPRVTLRCVDPRATNDFLHRFVRKSYSVHFVLRAIDDENMSQWIVDIIKPNNKLDSR